MRGVMTPVSAPAKATSGASTSPSRRISGFNTRNHALAQRANAWL